MHRFTINAIDMEAFCIMAVKAIPEIKFGVTKGYDQFDVVFSGTRDQAKQLKQLIEQKVCAIAKVSYARSLG